jgi:hypothetical protein
MSRVTMIDIAAEIAASARGECLACRIGARHKHGSECPGAKQLGDLWCARGCHDFPKTINAQGDVVRSGPCRHCGKA